MTRPLLALALLTGAAAAQPLIIPLSWAVNPAPGSYYHITGDPYSPVSGPTVGLPHLTDASALSAAIPVHAVHPTPATGQQTIGRYAIGAIPGPSPQVSLAHSFNRPSGVSIADTHSYLLLTALGRGASDPLMLAGQPFWVDPTASTTIAFEAPTYATIFTPPEFSQSQLQFRGLPADLAGTTFYVQMITLFDNTPLNSAVLTGDCYRVDWRDVNTYVPPSNQLPLHFPGTTHIAGWYIP